MTILSLLVDINDEDIRWGNASVDHRLDVRTICIHQGWNIRRIRGTIYIVTAKHTDHFADLAIIEIGNDLIGLRGHVDADGMTAPRLVVRLTRLASKIYAAGSVQNFRPREGGRVAAPNALVRLGGAISQYAHA